jgi:pimeloyl-ACP methyl ester carboxylesterase
MQVADEIVAKGVVERSFAFEADGEQVGGILWSPEGDDGARPLVLLGHGGTQHKRVANVLGLARRFVRHLGYRACAIDAPGHGDRVTDEAQAAARRRDLERRVTERGGPASAPRPMPADADAYAAAHARGAREWSALLDLLEADGLAEAGRVGYWGLSMGTMIGLPFVAAEPRVGCCVLGLAALSGWPNEQARADAARRLVVPVLFVLQWDDQLMTRQAGLDLFDALGSEQKAMHVFPGGHVDTPLYERDAYDAFFQRHLGRVGQ